MEVQEWVMEVKVNTEPTTELGLAVDKASMETNQLTTMVLAKQLTTQERRQWLSTPQCTSHILLQEI